MLASEKKTCLWQVKGADCGKPADGGYVRLGDAVAAARIPVCQEHKAEHNRLAAAHRVRR